jgi:uncharacterized cupin superfamily protein
MRASDVAAELKPIRRVVTGSDERGRSRVLFDSAAPNVNPRAVSPGSGMTDIWVFHSCPAVISGERDDGNLSFNFEPPEHGGHLRIVQSKGRPKDYDPTKDPSAVPVHAPRRRPGGTWDRGGQNAYSAPIHKSETIDYGIVLEGERVLVLDDGERVMRPGDVVVQLGNWHGWSNPQSGSLMAFVMMGAKSEDDDAALSAGLEKFQEREIPESVKPFRRIVTIDDANGKSMALQDGPSPDVRIDPARPGFSSTRIWLTDRARIKSVRETLHLPHRLEPPAGGSVLRIITYPPEHAYLHKIGAKEVRSFFEAVGSPGASTHSVKAAHPYMQRTQTLDFCLVLQGEITLVLDTARVQLSAGDSVVQRGTNHAFSNRSEQPCVLAISSHDAIY